MIRTISQTGQSGQLFFDPVRRDIRKADRLRSPDAVVPVDISHDTIEVVTLPPADAVGSEWFYTQDTLEGDNEDAASGNGASANPRRLQVSGLNADRFTRLHQRYLGAAGATTRQSQWFGCLYHTLADPNAFDIGAVTGGWFDPVTSTSAVFRWPELVIEGRPDLDIEYEVSVTADGLTAFSGTTEELSISLTGLNPARIYAVAIRARVAAQTGPSLSYSLATLGATQVPRNLNVKSMSLTSVTAQCDPLDCIDAYIWDLEDDQGSVIQTKQTSESEVSFSGLRLARRHRIVVHSVQAGQPSARTGLQFTTCLTDLYKGAAFDFTLPETSAFFETVNPRSGVTRRNPRTGEVENPPYTEFQGCANSIALITPPTEPAFAGGKIAGVRPRVVTPSGRMLAGCEQGHDRRYPIDIEAKAGDLFTQAGFTDAALTGKSLFFPLSGVHLRGARRVVVRIDLRHQADTKLQPERGLQAVRQGRRSRRSAGLAAYRIRMDPQVRASAGGVDAGLLDRGPSRRDSEHYRRCGRCRHIHA